MDLPVLIVEDNHLDCENMVPCLKEDVGYEVLVADTIEKAQELFHQHKSRLFLVAMDGRMNSDEPNTLELTTEFACDPEFTGFILATSSGSRECNALIDAGCFDGETEKWRVSDIGGKLRDRAEIILKYLGGGEWPRLQQEIKSRRTDATTEDNYTIFCNLLREARDA